MQSVYLSNSRGVVTGDQDLRLSRLPQVRSQVPQVGSVIISIPSTQNADNPSPLNEKKVDEIKIEGEWDVKKRKTIKIVDALLVEEEKALEQISTYKKNAITAAAGVVPGLIVGIAVGVTTGPLWGVLSGVFCGGTCAAAVRWKFMPHIIKAILKDEYNGNINKIFESQLKTFLMKKSEQLPISYQNKQLLLTAFKVSQSKYALPLNRAFSSEEVQELLQQHLFDSRPIEKYYGFWVGDIVGDFETTEKVNRAIIAYHQDLIETLEEALTGAKDQFTKEEIANISNIIQKLKDKLPSYIENLERNYEQLKTITRQCFGKRKDFMNKLKTESSLEIKNIELEASSSFGSLNEIRRPDYSPLDSTDNHDYRKDAFNGFFPPAYIKGKFRNTSFSRRIIDKVAFKKIKKCFYIEVAIREEVIAYEMGKKTSNDALKNIKDMLNKKLLSQDFRSEMLLYATKTIDQIDKGAKGYFKVENNQ